MTTSSIDDNLDGASIDAGLGMEDMTTLVVILLVLECQDLGDNEIGTQVIDTKHLMVFIFIHLTMHSYTLKGFHLIVAH